MAEARRPESFPVTFIRRVRHWSAGAIIGKKLFVREMAKKLRPNANPEKQLSHGTAPDGTILHCFRRLDPLIGG